VLTITGVIYGLLLGGAVLVETVFGWGGIGQYAVTAITQNDYFATQGFVLFAATFSVVVYLTVDLLHAALDPRVRRSF
jgi:peptide/nickel transport system permease protein